MCESKAKRKCDLNLWFIDDANLARKGEDRKGKNYFLLPRQSFSYILYNFELPKRMKIYRRIQSEQNLMKFIFYFKNM